MTAPVQIYGRYNRTLAPLAVAWTHVESPVKDVTRSMGRLSGPPTEYCRRLESDYSRVPSVYEYLSVSIMIARALDIYRTEGATEFLSAARSFAAGGIVDQWLRLKYRARYGELAPLPDERLWIDPRTIEYTLSSEYLYRDDRTYPRFGILDGSWDRQKNYWRDSRVWGGLQERFGEGLPWPETTYYRYSTTRLDADEDLPYLDGPQTRANFEAYLESLDELYEEIRTDGYDPSSVITVHVGRDGEWMVGHGNHRRTIASLAGVEAVPVRVKYRHREWQDLRRRVHDANSIDELSDVEEHLSHPDVPDLTFDDRPDEGQLNRIGKPRSTDRGRSK